MKAAKQEDLTKVKFSVSQLRDEIASLKSEVDTVRRQSAEDVKELIKQLEGLGKYVKNNLK